METGAGARAASKIVCNKAVPGGGVRSSQRRLRHARRATFGGESSDRLFTPRPPGPLYNAGWYWKWEPSTRSQNVSRRTMRGKKGCLCEIAGCSG